MRRLVALLTFTLLVLAPALAKPGQTYYIGDTPVTCTDDTTIAANEGDGYSTSFSWDPSCSSFESGRSVRFFVPPHSRDVHDPMSALDGGICFHSASPLPSGQAAFIQHSPMVDFEVQLAYEGTLVSARVVFRGEDGSVSFGPWHVCPGALDTAQSTPSEAVVPYQCSIHPSMRGLLVVEASGGVSVG